MTRMLSIGDRLPVFLAPMAGYTDFPFRKIAFELGLPYAVTEMVSAKALYYDSQRTIEISKSIGRTGIQLFGHEPEAFQIAIERYLNPREDFLWIDLNFGCPAPKIFKNQDGSALLNDLDTLAAIIKTCKKYSNKPVSAKMRLGVNDSSNAIEIAQRIEDAGADFLTVHGRTRDMHYTGQADWEKIFEIRDKLNIPVIGNGDIDSFERAIELLESDDIDGISIGRFAIGNPFIFADIHNYFSLDKINYDKYDIIKKHFKYMTEDFSERVALNDFKKHLIKYLNNRPEATKIRKSLSEINSIDKMNETIDRLFKNIEKEVRTND